jgi:hypothetical protein
MPLLPLSTDAVAVAISAIAFTISETAAVAAAIATTAAVGVPITATAAVGVAITVTAAAVITTAVVPIVAAVAAASQCHHYCHCPFWLIVEHCPCPRPTASGTALTTATPTALTTTTPTATALATATVTAIAQRQDAKRLYRGDGSKVALLRAENDAPFWAA